MSSWKTHYHSNYLLMCKNVVQQMILQQKKHISDQAPTAKSLITTKCDTSNITSGVHQV